MRKLVGMPWYQAKAKSQTRSIIHIFMRSLKCCSNCLLNSLIKIPFCLHFGGFVFFFKIFFLHLQSVRAVLISFDGSCRTFGYLFSQTTSTVTSLRCFYMNPFDLTTSYQIVINSLRRSAALWNSSQSVQINFSHVEKLIKTQWTINKTNKHFHEWERWK